MFAKMKMFVFFAYCTGINLLMGFIEMKKVEYRYFSTGEDITINCNCKASYWNGPAPLENFGFGMSQVKALNEYDELKVWNVSIYTQRNKVSFNMPQELFETLKVIGDNFDLYITNLSSINEGLYICDYDTDCITERQFYLLQHKIKPSIKVSISDTFIVEGETMNLCCTSRSIPKPSSILWLKDDKELVSTNGGSSLCYAKSNVSRHDTGYYTCSSKNEIGNASTDILLVISLNDSSEEKSLSSKGIIFILVISMLLVVFVLMAGMVIYCRYRKQKNRNRVITPINNQTAERNGDDSPHYEEINYDNNALATQQENNTLIIPATSIIGVEIRNTTPMSDVQSSGSSNIDVTVLDHLDDSYEKPYTTLVTRNGTEVEHVYLKFKQNSTNKV